MRVEEGWGGGVNCGYCQVLGVFLRSGFSNMLSSSGSFFSKLIKSCFMFPFFFSEMIIKPFQISMAI